MLPVQELGAAELVDIEAFVAAAAAIVTASLGPYLKEVVHGSCSDCKLWWGHYVALCSTATIDKKMCINQDKKVQRVNSLQEETGLYH